MADTRSTATSRRPSAWLLYIQAWDECFPNEPIKGEDNPPFSLKVLELFADKLLASLPLSAVAASDALLDAVCVGNHGCELKVRCQAYEASEQSAPCPPGCCVMADEKDVRAILAAIEREEAPQSETTTIQNGDAGNAPASAAPSETPRVDAAIAGQGFDAPQRLLDLARQLERDLAVVTNVCDIEIRRRMELERELEGSGWQRLPEGETIGSAELHTNVLPCRVAFLGINGSYWVYEVPMTPPEHMDDDLRSTDRGTNKK